MISLWDKEYFTWTNIWCATQADWVLGIFVMYVLWFQQILFEGTWGSSRANGFIGFDDITFFSAACSSKFMLTSVLLISVLYDITWTVITAKTSVIPQSIQPIKKGTTIFRKYMMHLCHLFSLPTFGTESVQLFIGEVWFSFPAIILRASCILMFCIVFWLWKLQSYKVWWHSFHGGSFTTCFT